MIVFKKLFNWANFTLWSSFHAAYVDDILRHGHGFQPNDHIIATNIVADGKSGFAPRIHSLWNQYAAVGLHPGPRPSPHWQKDERIQFWQIGQWLFVFYCVCGSQGNPRLVANIVIVSQEVEDSLERRMWASQWQQWYWDWEISALVS